MRFTFHLAAAAAAALTTTTVAAAQKAMTGNGAPSGSHYNLNIIGVSHDKNPNMNGNGSGSVIFVDLPPRSGHLHRLGPRARYAGWTIQDRDVRDVRRSDHRHVDDPVLDRQRGLRARHGQEQLPQRDQRAHDHYPRSGEPRRAGVRHAEREPVRYLPAGLPLAVRQQRAEAAADSVLPLLTRNSRPAPRCHGAPTDPWSTVPRRGHRVSYAVIGFPCRYLSNQFMMCCRRSTRCTGLPERDSSCDSPGNRTCTVVRCRYLSARNMASPP